MVAEQSDWEFDVINVGNCNIHRVFVLCLEGKPR